MIPTDDRRAILQGNDLATSFAFSFYVFDEADLRVVKTDANGNESTLTLGVDYSVTLSGSPGPGTVTYPATGSTLLATGETLTIYRNLSYTQQTDLTNAGSFQPEVVEKALDRLTMLALQLREELDRVPSFPVSADVTSKQFPTPEALSFIGWNGAGTGLENYPPLDATPYLEQVDSSLIQRATYTAASTTLTQQLPFTPATIDCIDVYVNGVRRAAGDVTSISLAGDVLTVNDVNVGDEIEVKGRNLAVAAGTVGTVGDNAVTEAKIADGAVTLNKLATTVQLRRMEFNYNNGNPVANWAGLPPIFFSIASLGGLPVAASAVLECVVNDTLTGHTVGDKVLVPVSGAFYNAVSQSHCGLSIATISAGGNIFIRRGEGGVKIPAKGVSGVEGYRPTHTPSANCWKMKIKLIGGW